MEEEKHLNHQFEGLEHGITPERIIDSSIQSMMTCPKCKHIYWNPQMCSTSKCGRTLCEPCLKRALEGGETCDKCKSSTKYEPNPFVANSLTELTFRCMNHPKCEILLEYEDLPYHICIYDQMKCPIMGCEWNGERKSLEEHLPICPKEILLCPNEGCGEKEKRGRLDEHRKECLFEEIYCPKECGYQGRRGVLAQHIENICPKVQLDCAYASRGCTYMPLRGDYQAHIDSCLYLPMILTCKHLVNLKDQEAHAAICDDFPLSCTQCGYVFIRRELAIHRCLPFLLALITEQEIKYTALEVSQNNKITTLEARILKIEEKHMREIERITEIIPIKCQLCKKLESRSTFEECSKCQNSICVECAPLCNKCHNHVCLNCSIPCYNCHANYCSSQLNTCTKCNQKFCECAPFINCTVCNQSSCPAHINTCQICTQKYCSCTPLEACIQCNKKYCSCTPLEACIQCNKKYCSCTPLEACIQCNKKYCSCTPLEACIQCNKKYCSCTPLEACIQCNKKYCSCTPLEACIQCNKKYCSCTPLEACIQCNKKYCSCTPLEACIQCNKKYCSCTPLVGCIQCKAPICNGCSNNIEGIGNVCGGCLQQAHNNKLELRAISSTYSSSSNHELSNLLQGGDSRAWVSKSYGAGGHPSASDHIILGCKTGSMAITKLIIRPHTGAGFNKMEMYVGEEGNWTLSHTLTQCQDNMIITLPHPLSAKFIKLKFTGVKETFFIIYEVQVFGIQLPQ